MTQLQLAEKETMIGDFVPPPYDTPHVWRQLEELLNRVSSVVAPVWPLADYVAVNPYQGVSDRRFSEARAFLKIFSDCETLMPLAYYARQFREGKFNADDIEVAVNELRSAGTSVSLSPREIIDALDSSNPAASGMETQAPVSNPDRHVRTISEHVDDYSDVNWTETIRDEVSKHCAAHYDEGQAVWSSPWKQLPLYQAWRSAALHDRNLEVLGIKAFRLYVSRLPQTPEAAIVHSLKWLGVPERLWESYLLCQAFSIPGWSAWTKYKDAEVATAEANDFAGLLAIRLAYDAALSDAFAIEVSWDSMSKGPSVSFQSSTSQPEDDSMLRLALLRASEIAYQKSLLGAINRCAGATPARKLAQMVFCIDVRSERIRRNLESVSTEIETFGFAGFFGMPIEYVPLGAKQGTSQLPVLLKPQFQLHEGLRHIEPFSSDFGASSEYSAIVVRHETRGWRELWSRFQGSAVGCFSFVETTGMLYGLKLLARAAGISRTAKDPKFDGLKQCDHDSLGPTLRGLNHQGITTSQQADLAESMLKNLGLTKDFARLVVFCGHASQTENNPLAAGLDCGACGGHSGEPNARMAAMLLNQVSIRNALADRGITIPADTHFLAGLHNTTTDIIEFFDLQDVPESHAADLQQLDAASTVAGKQTRVERMPSVASKSMADLMRRAGDWSEVRPEWGLAGNAAFIVAPREMTRHANLDGRAFLHSYDHHNDPDGAVLETIMTAPMVVANWINMQYYASTVDNLHFGSGNKTVHNVVGRFGILSGNGGDLMTGLPWQSLHDGDDYQHLPMRLQVVIAAPRSAIERVIEKHEAVENLVVNGWLHLIALDDGEAYRYADDGTWQTLDSAQVLSTC